jgi:uncharacterized protein with NAD-binding domain and iron-sulfur cluster
MSGRRKVAVLGAGVAGLTAAHELLEKGFDVTMFDKAPREEWGGRARSYGRRAHDPLTGELTKLEVPAEHGFRFFPGFYDHIHDTMAKIAIGESTALANLVPIHEELLSVTGKPRITLPASAPRGGKLVNAIRRFLQAPKDLVEVGLTQDDLAVFASKLWRFASSCAERRDEEYEGIDWRSFVQSIDRSEEYYWYLASGLTRTLVAAKAKKASTKTMGNIAIQIALCLTERNNTTDRVLNGPTNESWIGPWIAHLERYAAAKGLKLELVGGAPVGAVVLNGDRVTGVQVRRDIHDFDHVVCALSLESAILLAEYSDSFVDLCGETVANLKELEAHLTNMSGLQLYLKKDISLSSGHQILLDSPWGLTSISQRQFWSQEHRDRLDAASIGGVLSVDISSWDIRGLNNHPAAGDTVPPLEIFRETLRQLRLSLGPDGLEDENILGWCLEGQPEKLLVNATGTWRLRPSARCGPLQNFFFAGDYVQTKTDLACMEGANESARAAVNAILAAEGRADERCAMFDPAERHPAWLKVLQEMDGRRYQRGLPWGGIDVSDAVVASARALDAIGDQVLADDVATTSRASAPPGNPIRLPREDWDPEIQAAIKLLEGAQLKVQQAASLARPITDDEAERFLTVDRPSPGRKDPMFRRWRLHALAEEKGNYLIPFHVYEGDSLVIHGRAALEPLMALTRGSGYYPVVGQDGQGGKSGFAELWVMDYRDTSAGSYQELVLNFVVTTRKDHKPYRWTSPYSSIVPMMDARNRLFTPLLLVDTEEPINGGPILYGNDLFGTNKQPANIRIERDLKTGLKKFSWQGKGAGNRADVGSGRVLELESAVQDAADYIQLARVMGFAEVLRNARQAMNGEELQGGLLTLDHRPGKAADTPVDIRAAYKFAPRIRVLDESERRIERGPAVPDVQDTNSLSQLMDLIRFEPVIATYDHHLKSVLYLDGWPNPEGQPVPMARSRPKAERPRAEALAARDEGRPTRHAPSPGVPTSARTTSTS